MLTAALALLALPPALDGESGPPRNNTALAVISVVSIVFGYVLLALLWHFVFSAKARRRRGEKDPPR
jgi:Kef-type K+ transport system membrane component KefB